MIRLQQDLGFQYTDGKRINLRRLKNELDRKMLKIQFLAEKISFKKRLGSIVQDHHQSIQQTHAFIQTDQNILILENSSSNSNPLQEKIVNKFRKQSSTNKDQRPLIRDRKPLTLKENDFLICKIEEFSVDLEPQLKKIEESCTTMALSSIPEIEFPVIKQKRIQIEQRGSISPISKQLFKKTQRSILSKPKTSRTINNQLFPQVQIIIISKECLIMMENLVQGLKEKVRKEPTDHNLRTNIVKKIEEKFKHETKMQY